MSKLTNADLDVIEIRYINALKGTSDVPATTLEIMRKTLLDNGRLVVPVTPGDASELLSDDDEDNLLPFPVSKS